MPQISEEKLAYYESLEAMLNTILASGILTVGDPYARYVREVKPDGSARMRLMTKEELNPKPPASGDVIGIEEFIQWRDRK